MLQAPIRRVSKKWEKNIVIVTIKIIKPKAAREIDHLLEGNIKPTKTIQVPVYQYA